MTKAIDKDIARALNAAKIHDGFIDIGRGGVSIVWRHYGNMHVMNQGHVDIDAIISEAVSRGLPVCDTRTVPEENLSRLLRLPMMALPDVASPLYEDFNIGFKRRAELGATLYNVEEKRRGNAS